jgi:hypothetical protein
MAMKGVTDGHHKGYVSVFVGTSEFTPFFSALVSYLTYT